MILQIIIGTSLIILTVLTATTLMALAMTVSQRFRAWLIRGNVHARTLLTTGALSLLLVAVMTVVTWVWALAFFWLGIFDTIEEALYFSIVSFTTLGFGDIILPEEWRLLAGFLAMDGFILFGLSSAYMFELLRGMRNALNEAKNNPAL